MTTVNELIMYLHTIPPDAEVRVLVSYPEHYQTLTRWDDLKFDSVLNNVEFTDLSDNPFIKEDSSRFGKRFLDFGIEE